MIPRAGSLKINKIDKPLARYIKEKKKKTEHKSIKSEMKAEKLQPAPQKYKRS